ncbi:MAG: adenosylcobinamide amidohydrolase [Candidatus Bathyarchaeota archaeon]|nr:adenosylcobinamide amidohydrolase [Candidatus Bathyarchaeota archaeon]
MEKNRTMKSTRFKETKLNLQFKEADAKVIYHQYDGIILNTTLVSFGEKRRVLSTLDGVKRVSNVANVYVPGALSNKTMCLTEYAKFVRRLPSTLGIRRSNITFISTGVDMEKVAFCEQSFEDLHVCCIATGGARNNALRAGVDKGLWTEKEEAFQAKPGTINILILTNAYLTWGAMARALVTATEGKTAALQDLNYRSTPTPKVGATGTGTDNMIIVSGVDPKILIRHTGGHTKMGELIGFTAKTAVAEALKKHDN